MKNTHRTTFILVLVAALAAGIWAAPDFAYADDEKDHDRARQSLANKEILSLDEILAKVRAEIPGDVIDVELDDEGRSWVYELKIIEPSGKVVKIEADAKSGAILKTKRK